MSEAPELYEGPCEAGCVRFHGGEVRHHKDCGHYPDSLTRLNADRIEELEAKLDRSADSYNMLVEQNYLTEVHVEKLKAKLTSYRKAHTLSSLELFERLDAAIAELTRLNFDWDCIAGRKIKGESYQPAPNPAAIWREAMEAAASVMERQNAAQDPELIRMAMADLEEIDGHTNHAHNYRAQLIRSIPNPYEVRIANEPEKSE